MAQKSAAAQDKFSTPIGVKWNLKANEDGRLEWHMESKSGAAIADSKDKRKRAKAGEAGLRHVGLKKNDRVTSNTTNRPRNTAAHNQLRGKHGNRHASPSQLRKNAKNAIVMLDDIKAVAYDQLVELDSAPIAPDFDSIIFKATQFDDFLYNLLYYYDCFFKREELALKNQMSTSIEQGQAERKLFADACARVEIARKKLGRSYCHLVLGTLYTYCCFVVWITFKRKNFDVIKKEMGRTLRSDTFNPAIRVKNAPENDEDEKTDVNNPKKKMSPAEYRRIHPRRPAINSIVNQRSPAIVSILPSSKEEAPYLFKQIQIPSPTSQMANPNSDSLSIDLFDEVDMIDLQIQDKTLRIGILHDNMENYNHISLQGGGHDSENAADEEGDEAAKKEDAHSNGIIVDHKLPDGGVSRAPTGLSHATTEAPSEVF
ncbi:protein phosphatase 1 regulatory subunit 36-like isoform X2 [Watersipora subatra]|uniref:protein phosphatase 1 regulatory subunit 36-like isoform X2 n=1 Tax=Watersipora subatra TaxID=2589382 RepID=UPI00355B59BD